MKVRVASDPVKTLDLGPFAQELAKLRDQYQVGFPLGSATLHGVISYQRGGILH